jgi:trans-aconitate methyltransferase
MMPPSVRIQHSRGYLKLCLPNFFENTTLEDIRKIMKLLEKHPFENETTFVKLDSFFPAWELDIKARLIRAVEEQETAEQEMQDAKSRKARAVKRHYLDNVTGTVKRVKTILERYSKTMDAYKAIKAQKNLRD